MKFSWNPLSALALVLLSLPVLAHETEEHKLNASDGAAGDFLGRSVSVFGADIIAGASASVTANGKTGAAYIWSHDGSSFVEVAKLLASDGAPNDYFGHAVAMGDGFAVVGANRADAGAVNSGAAYVFQRLGSVWVQDAKLVPESPMLGGGFGSSVAILDDLILVGSPGSATAHFYRRSSSTFLWSQEWVMTSKDVTPDSRFGASVALENDMAVVGAGQQDGSGAAYVCSFDGVTWIEDQKLVPNVRNSGDTFGAAVAFGGPNRITVGAPNDDARALDAGASYGFTLQGGSWSQISKRTGTNSGDRLGSSVSVTPTHEVAGSRYFDFLGTSNTGSARLWTIGQNPISELYVSSEPSSQDFLGSSVSIDGCIVVAGSWGDDQVGTDAGAVYVFSIPEGKTSMVNGSGTNPVAMASATEPNIGSVWKVNFDLSVEPNADTAILMVYRKFLASPATIPAGELLTDLGSQRFILRLKMGTGIVEHTLTIPPDLSLLGTQAASQGFLQDSSTGSLRALNGELLVIGCEGGHTQ